MRDSVIPAKAGKRRLTFPNAKHIENTGCLIRSGMTMDKIRRNSEYPVVMREYREPMMAIVHLDKITYLQKEGEPC